MDEVFYIGESQCTRCSGRDKAELFADEVRTIRDHLAVNNRKLWIWGDRLIDGKTTGLGEWEASYNNTYKAIDLIPKDVMICDWHYERPDQTAVYFAMKGFNVVTCPWRDPANAVLQAQDMVKFRDHSTPEMKERFMGMVQTVWSGARQFLDSFAGCCESNLYLYNQNYGLRIIYSPTPFTGNPFKFLIRSNTDRIADNFKYRKI
jgi:hypothetical protein